MQDKLFRKYKIELEDYNLAISIHKLNQDEEALRLLNEVEAQYPDDLKKRIVNVLTNQG